MSIWRKKETISSNDAVEDWCYECNKGDFNTNTPFTDGMDVKWLCEQHLHLNEPDYFDNNGLYLL